MKNIYQLRHVSRLVLPLFSALTLVATGGQVFATEDSVAELTIDEEKIVQRLKEELMQELQQGTWLQEQIEKGIQAYVLKQQLARTEAQRKKLDKAAELARNIRPVSADRDHILGNPEARLSLVEYSDFECPFCKKFHPTAKRLVDAFDGRLNWVYRHFPLSFHNPGAQKQAEASECANEIGGKDMFWTYTDTIYERTMSNGRGFPISSLVPLAVELGMDEKAFATCLESGRFTQRVIDDFKEGTSIGITGTPGNIILDNRSGKTLVRSGALPFNQLKADIDGLLNAE